MLLCIFIFIPFILVSLLAEVRVLISGVSLFKRFFLQPWP